MIDIIIANLLNEIDVRENLSLLRKSIKDDVNCDRAITLLSDHIEQICGFLSWDDAKIRKNAALLLGDLSFSETADRIFSRYLTEDMLFVRSSYLKALANMDIAHLVPQIKEQQNKISREAVTDENRKHIQEELRELNNIIISYEGIRRHKADTKNVNAEVVLTCNRLYREEIRNLLEGYDCKVHPLGVAVKTDNILGLFKFRFFREMLFPIHAGKGLKADIYVAADQLYASDMMSILNGLHQGSGAFYYRIECKSDSEYARKLSGALDRRFGGLLVNSPKDYEIELRLIKNKSGMFYPCLKLFTLHDNRFSYRKNAVSSSIHPSTAALLMELAKPYLKENAQIMDSFCGVGTMLIERDKLVKAREMYGTDTFGDAIIYARENTKIVGKHINYIHRDFFDFRHQDRFDEIITNMPWRGKKSQAEMEDFINKFFTKAKEVLDTCGTIIMYTNESAIVKEQIENQSCYHLLMEKVILDKKDFELLVIGYEG